MAHSRFRSTYWLLGFFVILLLVVLFFGTEGADKSRRRANVDAPFLKSSQLENMSSISFASSGAEDLHLERDDESQWTVGSFLVDKRESDQLIEALMELPTGKVVSKNKDNWYKYGLSEGSTSDIILSTDNEEVAQLFVGSRGPSFQTLYVRRDDDDQVYLVKSSLDRFFNYDVARWRDKRVLPLDLDTVVRVSVRVREEKWSFENASGSWILVGEDISDTPAEEALILDYFDDLFGLRAETLEADVSLFGESDNVVFMEMTDGSTFQLGIDKQEEKVYAQLSSQEDLMVLSSDFSARLRPSFLEITSDENDSPEDASETASDGQ